MRQYSRTENTEKHNAAEVMKMKQSEQQKAAKEFAEFWKGKGYEKGQSQTFWISLLSNVFGIQCPEAYITFEYLELS